MRRTPALLLVVGLVLGASACGSSDAGGSDAGPAPSTSAATTTTTGTYEGLDPEQLTLRPVVAIVACAGAAVPGSSTTSTELPAHDAVLTSTDGATCYHVGPVAGDGTDLRDAKVYADGVGIEVSTEPASVDTLNAAFNACYQAAATCPAASKDGHGYLAIVVDGAVVSAPAVNAEDLASSPFVITGDFDQQQADNLATAINGY